METKRALITGITGQDGSYLSELLLSKGYIVYGLVRRCSSPNTDRIAHMIDLDDVLEDCGEAENTRPRLILILGDLADQGSLHNAVHLSQPHEIYNLGAQSHVGVSFKNPVYTSDVVALGLQRLLEAVRQNGLEATCRVYQASSSEQFGEAPAPQDENTPMLPMSPYGISKYFAYRTMQNYRDGYKMFCSNGILFNHESPRRGENFVTRKITRRVAKISLGLEEGLQLGNIYSKRDWGHAKDYVRAMWMILQQDQPDDYVISTNVLSNIKEFTEWSFKEIGETIEWSGEGVDEIGVCKENGKTRVSINPRLFRATEVGHLLGDCTKAKAKLGWTPEISLGEMCSEMVRMDIDDCKHVYKLYK